MGGPSGRGVLPAMHAALWQHGTAAQHSRRLLAWLLKRRRKVPLGCGPRSASDFSRVTPNPHTTCGRAAAGAHHRSVACSLAWAAASKVAACTPLRGLHAACYRTCLLPLPLLPPQAAAQHAMRAGTASRKQPGRAAQLDVTPHLRAAALIVLPHMLQHDQVPCGRRTQVGRRLAITLHQPNTGSARQPDMWSSPG